MGTEDRGQAPVAPEVIPAFVSLWEKGEYDQAVVCFVINAITGEI